MVLENQAKENLKITANGAFAFATAWPTGTAYSVDVATQPAAPDQQCSVTNGDGTTASSDVSNITVSCVTVIGADSARNVASIGNHSVESLLQLASFVGERLTYLSGHLASTATEACADAYGGQKSGSATYTFTDTDASGSLTPGDTVVIVATKCLSPSLADYASGTLTVTLVPPPAAVTSGVSWFATADLSSLQFSNRTLDGRLDVDYIAQETTQTVRARAGTSPALQITYSFPSDIVTFTSADSSKTIDYTIPGYSVQLAAVFQSKSLLGPYGISTPEPLQGRLGIYPVSGTEKFSAGPSVLEYGARDVSDTEYVQASLDATGTGSPTDLGTGTSSFAWNDGFNGFCWYEPRGDYYLQYGTTPGYSTARRDQWQMRLMFTEPAQSDPINQILSTGMDANTPIKLFFSGPVDPSTLSVDFKPVYYGHALSTIAAVPAVAGPIVTLTAQSQLEHGQTYTLETLSPVQSTWPTVSGANITLDLTTFNNLQADAGPSPGVAAPGQTVTLRSTRSFSTNSTIVHYAWTQTGGPAVTLSGVGAASATFAVPAGGHDGDALHFNLTVTDANGSTDSVPVTVFVLTDLTQPFLYYRQQQAAAVGQIDELAVLESPAGGTIRTELGGVPDPAEDLFRFIYTATNNVRPLSDELQFMTPGHAIAANAYTSANTPGGMPFLLSSLPFQCNDPAWTFTVYESVSAGDGTAAKFAADFIQACPGNLPPFTGSIRVNSTVPLP